MEGVMRWSGNARVDALARQHARRLRHDDALDASMQRRATRATPTQAALHQLAMSTAWSLRNWPEVGPRAAKRPRRTDTALAAGPHTLIPRAGGGQQCVRCRLFTTTGLSLKSLRNTPCLGEITSQCHSSHRLRWQRGILWCTRCARYTVRIPRALKQTCPGRPASIAAQNVWRRLHEGLPPTTAHYLLDDARDGCDDDGPMEAAHGDDAGGAVSGGGQPTHAAASGRYLRLDARREVEEGRRAAEPAPRPSRDSRNTLCHDAEPYVGHAVDGHAQVAEDARVDDHALAAAARRGPADDCYAADSSGDATASRQEPQQECRHHQSTTVINTGRRRMRGKQLPSPVSYEAVRATPLVHPSCTPSAVRSWTMRLDITSSTIASPCHLCYSAARSSCRGCGRSLCVQCARNRDWCSIYRAADSAGG